MIAFSLPLSLPLAFSWQFCRFSRYSQTVLLCLNFRLLVLEVQVANESVNGVTVNRGVPQPPVTTSSQLAPSRKRYLYIFVRTFVTSLTLLPRYLRNGASRHNPKTSSPKTKKGGFTLRKSIRCSTRVVLQKQSRVRMSGRALLALAPSCAGSKAAAVHSFVKPCFSVYPLQGKWVSRKLNRGYRKANGTKVPITNLFFGSY